MFSTPSNPCFFIQPDRGKGLFLTLDVICEEGSQVVAKCGNGYILIVHVMIHPELNWIYAVY